MSSPFRTLLAAVGLGAAMTAPALAAPSYAPYANAGIDAIYNLLFCDDANAFAAAAAGTAAHWQSTLFAKPADVATLERLAADDAQEGRIRYLAYGRLRALGRPVPPKVLLGVIVEVPLAGGLDTLAAFSEGGVRYINQTGKLAVLEDVPSVRPLVQRLFDAARPVVDHIGPWDKPRLAPPTASNVRLTFLVSDGLYFGQGPMNVMAKEPLAAPVIRSATELLQAVVATGTK